MLTDGNISLRFLRRDDLDFLYSIENDPTNYQYTKESNYFSKEILSKYISNASVDIGVYNQLRFVISFKKNPIGLIDLFDYDSDSRKAGISILVLEGFRSKQHGSKALDLLISYSWNSLDLLSLFANIKEENIKSISLFNKFNFLKKGKTLYQLDR